MSYKRFFGMILTSTVIMFGLMYSTAYRFSDGWWSQTRFWMAVFMGAAMAIVMLAWMLNMYRDRRTNIIILGSAVVLFAAGLLLARSQRTVNDVSWMKAMIPHHSIAILTSERARISDPRVRRLADEIILAQKREIVEMEALIADLQRSDYDGGVLEPSVTPVVGGSMEATGPVPGAPALSLAEQPFVGDVLMLRDVKVVSDAWVVVHPAAGVGGGPDVSRVLGRSFVQHGTTGSVPVTLDLQGVSAGDTLYVMLHDDTDEVGRFEFGGAGTADQPLMANGAPVVQTVVVP